MFTFYLRIFRELIGEARNNQTRGFRIKRFGRDSFSPYLSLHNIYQNRVKKKKNRERNPQFKSDLVSVKKYLFSNIKLPNIMSSGERNINEEIRYSLKNKN